MSTPPETPATNDPASEIIRLTQRVVHLEAQVVDLQRVTNALTSRSTSLAEVPATSDPAAVRSAAPGPPSLPLPPKPAAPVQVAAAPRRSFDLVGNSQYWLNKIGIAMLLLGVGFLFKYSVDQGWLTPAVRVLFGTLLGGGLIGLGVRLRTKQQHFSQVVQGGGVGVLYLTTFAAFQLYNLLPYSAAFAVMCSVTLLAFGLAVWQNAQVLALIAAIGGLATPFLLYTDSGNVAGLVGYTCLLLVGTAAIYQLRPWRSLLLTTFVGGWLIFAVSADAPASALMTNNMGRWALLFGIIFSWLSFWLLPILRVEIHPPSPASPDQNDPMLHGLTLLTPLIALGVFNMVWWPLGITLGWIAVAGAAVYALAAWALRGRVSTGYLAVTHVFVALTLLTLGFVLLLSGDVLFLAVAIEAMLLLYVATRYHSTSMELLGHGLFAWLAVWLMLRLIDSRTEPALLNSQALTELAGLGLGLFSVRFLRQRLASLYGVVLYILMLGWLGYEFGQLFDGNGFVTVAWGVYAVTLLLFGLRRDVNLVVVLGLVTVVLVLAKLLVIDLAELKAIWRIMLFLGFGGVFLTLSYFFQSLWRPRTQQQP